MSFLNLVLFASAFYFAYARPDASIDSAVASPPANPFQQQMDDFKAALDDAMTKYMMPIISQITSDTQQDYKTMATNGCYSYLNYVMSVAQQKQGNGNGDTQSDDGGNPQDREDIIIEFENLNEVDDDALLLPAVDVPQVETTAESDSGDSQSIAVALT